MTATAICGTTATLAPQTAVVGAVEALLGLTTLAQMLCGGDLRGALMCSGAAPTRSSVVATDGSTANFTTTRTHWSDAVNGWYQEGAAADHSEG